MEMQMTRISEDRTLFPTAWAVRAIRDSRYHNTAYAVAELIDNAIDADAPKIDLLCLERVATGGQRRNWRVEEVAVLDNGDGMDRDTLYSALRWGGGTRHQNPAGIGKYGMGLPTASMSQGRAVDVWTWQGGLENLLHSRIDFDEIAAGNLLAPEPDTETDIPNRWRRAGRTEIFGSSSGTLVVWSKLDKLQWRRGKTIIENAEREVGRIHRKWITLGLPSIRAATLREPSGEILDETEVTANDPLYLLERTSVPEEPWDEEPMFEEWATRRYRVSVDGAQEEVVVTYSIVKPEALKTETVSQNPGNTPRGRHCRHNIGVSVLREDREIVLEDAFLREGGSADNPQNRWWGCEVEFRRACDELFGVDHNKQMVAHFSQAARTLARDDRSNEEIMEELGLDDDFVHTLVGDIRDQTRAMMRKIRQMFAQRRPTPPRKKKVTPENKATRTATDADRDAMAEGRESPTQTDRDREEISAEEREEGLTEQFVELGQEEGEARELARWLVEEGLSYQFNALQLDGYQMFNVRSNQGVLHINLNTDHPVYGLLRHIESDVLQRLQEDDPAYQATVAIRLLLSSWGRMEDQTEAHERRALIQDTGMTWGRHVAKVIDQWRERTE